MATNPFLDRMAKAGTNAHGKASEKKVIKALGAKAHPNSGAMRGAKSDASLKGLRLEMKSTTTLAMSLELAWLVKITLEALDHGQVPGVIVSFVNPDGSPRKGTHAQWALVPLATFQEWSEGV